MKYKLGKKNKRTGLYRIVALQNISTINVKAGDEGGLIEKESNLSQEGNARSIVTGKQIGRAHV